MTSFDAHGIVKFYALVRCEAARGQENKLLLTQEQLEQYLIDYDDDVADPDFAESNECESILSENSEKSMAMKSVYQHMTIRTLIFFEMWIP